MVNSRTKSTFVLVGAMMAFFALITVVVAQKSSEMLVGNATNSVRGDAKQAVAKIDRMMAGVQAVIENQRWNVTENGWTVEIVCPVDEIVRGSRETVSRIVCFSVFAPMTAVLLTSRYLVRDSHPVWNFVAWMAGTLTYHLAGSSPVGPTLTAILVSAALTLCFSRRRHGKPRMV